MISTLTIVRYPQWMGWAGFLSMAIFRLPLSFNPSVSFWKLMGCGKNGSFDKIPDLRQWAILTVTKKAALDSGISTVELSPDFQNTKTLYGKFIAGWWKLFGCETWTLLLEPLEGHGFWDGKQPFGQLPKTSDYEGPVGILTRATIRLSKLSRFWSNVTAVANRMAGAKGFIGSVGIGEIPWIKQATFSLWESKDSMKLFAYQMQEHAAVINKTRKENWYSEEMFIRFKPIASFGSLNGVDPLKRKPYLANQ